MAPTDNTSADSEVEFKFRRITRSMKRVPSHGAQAYRGTVPATARGEKANRALKGSIQPRRKRFTAKISMFGRESSFKKVEAVCKRVK
eukprot:TRINITY_DN20779_c0_g1_i1.p1 TRINITY_DN20779_c0_g1~~TRINITY_DN20779_c0_g1_i1.p1  ORF type:complete len:101 (-),score=12.12 TRINITY_DN20779_c0_g1_i1:455-718(-)